MDELAGNGWRAGLSGGRVARVCRERGPTETEALWPDAGSSGAVKQPEAVAENDPCDAEQDLVEQTRLQALPGHTGAEDVDAPVPAPAASGERDPHRVGGTRPATVTQAAEVAVGGTLAPARSRRSRRCPPP